MATTEEQHRFWLLEMEASVTCSSNCGNGFGIGQWAEGRILSGMIENV